MERKPLIVIAGPTACGKTALSIELAKELKTEIISADSMQIYKYMDVGTAKVSVEEMQGIPHHLIDELEPDEKYSVAIFQSMAKERMDSIYKKGKIPIIVGGTGFYINALLRDNDFSEIDPNAEAEGSVYRRELTELSVQKGSNFLHDMLRDVDPESAEKIDMNNTKRVIRALEYYQQTGKKISDHNAREKQKDCCYNAVLAVLNTDRKILYDRINKRVDIMLQQGLVEEVQELLNRGYTKDLISMQGLGYKELSEYLEGMCTLEDAVEILKRDTRRFAKRQLTWFRHQTDGIWFDISDTTIQQMCMKIKDLTFKNIDMR